VSNVMLINGVAMEFLKLSQGLRKGCTLSHLLFLLVVDDLSRVLMTLRVEGMLKGIQDVGGL
jgi:hypothetical protein